jgi:hypothetical protein
LFKKEECDRFVSVGKARPSRQRMALLATFAAGHGFVTSAIIILIPKIDYK